MEIEQKDLENLHSNRKTVTKLVTVQLSCLLAEISMDKRVPAALHCDNEKEAQRASQKSVRLSLPSEA